MVAVVAELNPICIGVDVGQIHDPTAIAVAEVSQLHDGRWKHIQPRRAYFDAMGQFVPQHDADPVTVSEYTIRHIERVPLNTSYPDVAKRLADMLCKPVFYRRKVRVLIDVTGVGRPVYDDLRKEASLRHESREAWIKPISFTHGEKYNRGTGALAKAFLVSRLQSLLQSNRVHAPETREVKIMLDELRVYEIKVNQDGSDTYGAFKVGTHDDLATALGLACLEDPFSDRVSYSNRVY